VKFLCEMLYMNLSQQQSHSTFNKCPLLVNSAFAYSHKAVTANCRRNKTRTMHYKIHQL